MTQLTTYNLDFKSPANPWATAIGSSERNQSVIAVRRSKMAGVDYMWCPGPPPLVTDLLGSTTEPVYPFLLGSTSPFYPNFDPHLALPDLSYLKLDWSWRGFDFLANIDHKWIFIALAQSITHPESLWLQSSLDNLKPPDNDWEPYSAIIKNDLESSAWSHLSPPEKQHNKPVVGPQIPDIKTFMLSGKLVVHQIGLALRAAPLKPTCPDIAEHYISTDDIVQGRWPIPANHRPYGSLGFRQLSITYAPVAHIS